MVDFNKVFFYDIHLVLLGIFEFTKYVIMIWDAIFHSTVFFMISKHCIFNQIFSDLENMLQTIVMNRLLC